MLQKFSIIIIQKKYNMYKNIFNMYILENVHEVSSYINSERASFKILQKKILLDI